MHIARDFPAADLYPIFFDTRICAYIGSRSRRKTREDRSTAGAGAGRQRDNCPNGSRSSSSTTGVRLMFKEEFHRPTILIRPTSSTAERPLLFGGTDLLPRGRASPERPNGGLKKCCPPTGDRWFESIALQRRVFANLTRKNRAAATLRIAKAASGRTCREDPIPGPRNGARGLTPCGPAAYARNTRRSISRAASSGSPRRQLRAGRGGDYDLRSCGRRACSRRTHWAFSTHRHEPDRSTPETPPAV